MRSVVVIGMLAPYELQTLGFRLYIVGIIITVLAGLWFVLTSDRHKEKGKWGGE